LNTYRAATQSITMDEAYCWREIISRAPDSLFSVYDACYHVLHTWLCWGSVSLFRLSEFSLRLPGLIAGFFYLAAVYRLSRLLFGSSVRLVIGVALLSTHPLILDHLSIARGYGMALAFFAWAFHDVICWLLARSETRRLPRAGLLLGLSIGSNLTFALPAAALIAMTAALDAGQTRRLPWRIAERLGAPALVVAFAIVILPLAHAKPGAFYFGAESLAASLNTLVHPSLAHYADLRPEWVKWAEWTIVPALFVALIAKAAGIARRRRVNAATMATVLSVGGLLTCLSALIAAHATAGVLYPWSRTGIYLIWFFLVGCAAVWAGSSSRVFAVACTALAVLFAMQIEVSYYTEFREDADMRTLMRRVAALPGPHRLAASFELDTVVDFYRARYRMDDWLYLKGREPAPDADVYILLPKDSRIVAQQNLRVVWTGRVSGVVVAMRGHRPGTIGTKRTGSTARCLMRPSVPFVRRMRA
jgi:hypothetical protein